MNKIFTYSIFLISFLFCSYTIGQNDNCVNAANIVLPSNGYGFASGVTSATFSIDAATTQAGETFHPSVPSGKTIWFKFHLPTTRHIAIGLRESAGRPIAGGNVGYTLYYAPSFTCIPPQAARIDPVATMINDFNDRRCFLAGDYLIQVSADLGATGDVFVEFLTIAPSSSVQGDTLYDYPFEAYNFSIVSNDATGRSTFGVWDIVNYQQGCQSIYQTEDSCSNKSNYNKSSWHVFTTDNHIDYFRAQVREVTGTGTTWQYSLYEGDVRSDSSALTALDSCRNLTQGSSVAFPNGPSAFYECLLEPNTTYSMQLIYPRNYKSAPNNVEVAVYELGRTATISPDPLNITANGRNLGTLPTGTTNATDIFACNAQMKFYDAAVACPTLIQDTLNLGGVIYDLSTWMTFTLGQDANVDMRFIQNDCQPNAYIRVFRGNIQAPSPCTNLTLYDQWNNLSTRQLDCMPAGTYTIQILGQINRNFWDNNCATNLAADFTMQIIVQNVPTEDFSMRIPSAFETVNLINFNNVVASRDTFDCNTTPLPTFTCAGYDRAMYRTFTVSQSGVIEISAFDCNYRYVLYQGAPTVVAGVATGLNNLHTCTCGLIRLCITPGTYTFVTFGNSTDVGLNDQPSFLWRPYLEDFSMRTPSNFDAVNALVPLPNATNIDAAFDTFDCNTTPIPANGATGGCNKTRAMYRVIEIGSNGWLTITNLNWNYYYRLYRGDVSNTVAHPNIGGFIQNLQPVDLCTYTDGCTVSGCFEAFSSSAYYACVQPGRYTLVTFGDPNIFDDIGNNDRPRFRFDNYTHNFGFTNLSDYDQFNGGLALTNGVTYPSISTQMDCQSSRYPEVLCNISCNKKFTYRYFRTNQSGDLVITGMNSGLQYRLFTGTPAGISFDADTVLGLTPYISACNAINCFSGISRTINCLPAGDYFLVSFGDLCDVGKTDNPSIRLNRLPTQRFNLSTATAVDLINNMNPLVPGVTYNAVVDTFDCGETLMPTNGCFGSLNSCVTTANRAMYRIINIGQPGVLTVRPGAYYGCHNVRHILYQGNARDTAVLHGLLGNDAAQLPNMLDLSGCQHTDCFFFCNPQPFKHCVSPGTYTLVTLGNCSDIGQQDQPSFVFQTIGTAPYTTPATAEQMSTLSLSNTTITATKTWVECNDNPLTIMGNAPCGGATKQFYREFYMDANNCVSFQDLMTIYQTPQAGCTNFSHSLFAGQISQGTLTSAVQTCFTALPANFCLTRGWYTIVSYGNGGTFANNDYCGGFGDDILDTTYFRITITNTDTSRYNTFAKADMVNGGIPISWVPKPSRGHSITAPVQDTIFCLSPAVWSKCETNNFPAGIVPCANPTAYDRASYRVFTLAKPSYVYIYGLNSAVHNDNGAVATQYQSRLYGGNITNGTILPPFTIMHDCIYNDMRICLAAGTYTLITFTNYTTGACSKTITPRIYLDSLAVSKYDHALNAYNFGEIPNNNIEYPGAVGYTLDAFGRAPSNDFITCSTGSKLSDPDHVAHEGVHHLAFSSADGLFYDLPRATDPRRNLWYTFTARGGGRIIVKVKQKTSTIGANDVCGTNWGCNNDMDYKTTKPNFAVYINDDLTATDSTLAQGLTYLDNNEEDFFNVCYTLRDSIIINRSACGAPLQRYHVLVDLPIYNEPNVQYEVSIRYENSGVAGVEYDHYSTANHIARFPSLQADAPPYPNDTLHQDSISTGSWVLLECLTEDPTDQQPAGCGFGTDMHTAWYTFYADHGGEMLISYDRSGSTLIPNCNFSQFGNFRHDVTEMVLFKSVFAGDSTSSGLFPMTALSTVTNDPVGQQWRRFCYDAGRYYIMFTGCDCYGDSIRPHIKFRPREGDHCFDPMVLTIPDGVPPGGTVASSNVSVDCWTIGEAIGEDGSNMGCLDGPIGYKSGWFMIDLQEDALVDVNIELNLGTLVGVAQSDVSFRTATSDCNALTFTGECVTQLNDNITLACRTNQVIYIQVTLPNTATGTLGAVVTVTPNTVVPPCDAVNPDQPIASFTANADCEGQVVQFDNNSTTGAGVTYSWDFGDGFTSNLMNPTHTYDTAGTYTVVLVVNNGLATDTTAILVTVYPSPSSNFSFTPSSPVILGTPITFANTSSDTFSNGSSTYQWDFCRGVDSRILLAGTLSSPTGTNAPLATLNSANYWEVFNPQLQAPGTHYIQFDAGSTQTIIAVGTQGATGNFWVQTYKVSYSTNGVFYNFIQDASGNDVIFNGNNDINTIIINSIGNFDARYIRIYPWTWNASNRFRMRMGVYTCDANIVRYNGQNPPAVTYSQVGQHLTCLTVGNGACYDTICQPIDVYLLTPFGGGPYDGAGDVYIPKVCPLPVNIFAGGPEDPCQVTERLVANIGCSGSTLVREIAFTCPPVPDTCDALPVACQGCFFAGGAMGGDAAATLPPPATGGPIILTGDTICVGSSGLLRSNPATNWYQQTSPGVYVLLATNTTTFNTAVVNSAGSVYYYVDNPFSCGAKLPVEVSVQNETQPAFVTNSGCIGGTGGPSTFTNLTPVPGPSSQTVGVSLTNTIIGLPPSIPGQIAFSSQNGTTNLNLFANNNYDNTTIAWRPNNSTNPSTHWVVWRYATNKSVNRLFIWHDSTSCCPITQPWLPEGMRLFYHNGSGWVQVKAWTRPQYAYWDTGTFFETAGIFSTLWKLEIDESTELFSPIWREFQIFASDEVIAGPGLTAFWNFGDGNTSSLIHPVHQYLSAGTYNVTLTTEVPGLMCSNSVVMPVTVTDCSILLPVQLLSFNANLENNSAVRTHWVTEMEQDNDYFTVERSADGIHFVELGIVQSQGNSSSNQYYELYDFNPLWGNSYYRLKQTDKNGNWKYSGIAAVYIAKPDDQISVIPNPNNGLFDLKVITEHIGHYKIILHDPLGKIVLQETTTIQSGQNIYTLNISDMPTGVYLLVLKSQDGLRSFTQKVVKVE